MERGNVGNIDKVSSLLGKHERQHETNKDSADEKMSERRHHLLCYKNT